MKTVVKTVMTIFALVTGIIVLAFSLQELTDKAVNAVTFIKKSGILIGGGAIITGCILLIYSLHSTNNNNDNHNEEPKFE